MIAPQQISELRLIIFNIFELNHPEFRLEVRDDLFLPKMMKLMFQLNKLYSKASRSLVPLWNGIKGEEFLDLEGDSTLCLSASPSKGRQLLLGFIALIAFTSCGPNYIFDEEKIIADSNWTYSDSLVFQFDISDTTKVYNLNLEVEHETAYRHQNLYVQIATLFPSKKRNEQVLSLELANKYGAWLGDCNSENCSLLVPLQQQIYFQEIGTYDFVLKQFMRESSVNGVQKFALKIEETELKK